MGRLRLVTMTGADDSVDPELLWDLSEEFPFVEWGLLVRGAGQLQQDGSPKPRWPSPLWMDRLAEYAVTHSHRPTPRFAIHLCGLAQIRILECSPELFHLVPRSLFDLARRIQVNTHGEDQGWARPADIAEMRNDYLPTHTWLQQIDGGCGESIYRDLFRAGVPILPFYDLSHGAGITPKEWPTPDPDAKFIGFGGGLGPDNLRYQISNLSFGAALDHDYWVDMETKLRSVQDGLDVFDLKKVTTCLNIARDFIRLQSQKCRGTEVLVDTIPSWGSDGNVYKTYHCQGCPGKP